MSSDITAGIGFECETGIGGANKLILIPYVDDALTITDSEVTAIDDDITVAYEYSCAENTLNYTDVKTPSRETGSSPGVQTLGASIKKTSAAKTAILNVLSEGRVIAFVKDNNDIYHALGIWRGMTIEVTKQSGTATADGNVYILNGNADAKKLSPSLSSTAATALEALV